MIEIPGLVLSAKGCCLLNEVLLSSLLAVFDLVDYYVCGDMLTFALQIVFLLTNKGGSVDGNKSALVSTMRMYLISIMGCTSPISCLHSSGKLR